MHFRQDGHSCAAAFCHIASNALSRLRRMAESITLCWQWFALSEIRFAPLEIGAALSSATWFDQNPVWCNSPGACGATLVQSSWCLSGANLIKLFWCLLCHSGAILLVPSEWYWCLWYGATLVQPSWCLVPSFLVQSLWFLWVPLQCPVCWCDLHVSSLDWFELRVSSAKCEVLQMWGIARNPFCHLSSIDRQMARIQMRLSGASMVFTCMAAGNRSGTHTRPPRYREIALISENLSRTTPNKQTQSPSSSPASNQKICGVHISKMSVVSLPIFFVGPELFNFQAFVLCEMKQKRLCPF